MKPISYSDPKALSRLQHLRLRTEAVLDSLQKGQHLNPRPGFSIEFAHHREYSAGDDLRYLDWKAYARSDRFYVKEFQDETSLTCYLAVDNSLSMSFKGPSAAWTKYDHAATLASCLAWLVIQQRDAVGLSLVGGKTTQPLGPSDDPRQWTQVVKLLEAGRPARQEVDWLGGLARLGAMVKQRGVLFLISDWLDDLHSLGQILRQFRESLRLDVRVVHVLDPDEIEPTLRGTVELQDLEKGGNLRVHADQIRQAYLQEVERYLADLKQTCHRFGARYHLAVSSEAIVTQLQHLLAPDGH